jgi:hypothetical protein
MDYEVACITDCFWLTARPCSYGGATRVSSLVQIHLFLRNLELIKRFPSACCCCRQLAILQHFSWTIVYHSLIALLITLISIDINDQLTEYIPYKAYKITNIYDDDNQLYGSEYKTNYNQGCDVVVVYFDVVSEDRVILYYFI